MEGEPMRWQAPEKEKKISKLRTEFKVGDHVRYGSQAGRVSHIWHHLKKIQCEFNFDLLGETQFIVLCDYDGHQGLSKYRNDWPQIQKIESRELVTTGAMK